MSSRPVTGSTEPAEPREAADQAIPRLLEAQGGKMLSLALRMCGTRHEAEDLVQETFLQAYRNWDQFQGRSAATTWLYTIAARLCRRMRRKRAGEPPRIASFGELSPFGDGPVPDLPADDEGPLSRQLRREAQDRVEGAIVSLPTAFRLPLILKEIVGFSVAEVAEILGLKEATVKTRLHRARHVLRRELSESLPQREAPPAAYSRRVCLDLLRAKQESLDRDAPFPMSADDFCERCRAVFKSMDLAHDACEQLGRQELPPALRRAVLKDIAAEGRR
jgi:RNA polymerase sigma-70 factor (ECF subfamily)